jgi:hypothetical protein
MFNCVNGHGAWFYSFTVLLSIRRPNYNYKIVWTVGKVGERIKEKKTGILCISNPEITGGDGIYFRI